MDNQVTKLGALDKLIDDCGFRELFSRVWVERVRGIVPNYGYVVDSDGLFMNIASGVPLHQMTFGTPKHRMRDIVDVLKSVNSSLVIKVSPRIHHPFVDPTWGNGLICLNRACRPRSLTC